MLAKIFIKNYKDIKNQKVRTAYGKMCGIVGIITNAILCTVKILTGFFSGSVAIIADGINNLADAGSSLITLIGFKLAAEPADNKHPYGHERIEYLTGMIISIIILFIGGLLLKSSVEKIIAKEVAEINYINLIILGIAIVIKCWQSIFYKRNGKLINSNALIATSTDSLNDCISTGAVFISCLIALIWEINLDGYFGIFVSLFIIISGIKLIKETVSPLIGEKPNKELIELIHNKVMSYEGILGIHDLIVHSYGPNKTFVTLHAEVDSRINILDSHDTIDTIEQSFKSEEGIDLVIHMDPIEVDSPITNLLKKEVEVILKKMDNELKFHDFRVVIGTTHTNLIFDVVIPIEYKLSDMELKEEISKKIKEYDNKLNVVITIDHNYIG